MSAAVRWAALHCRNPTQFPATGSTWIQAPVLFAPLYSCIKLSIAIAPLPGSEQQLCWYRAAAASRFVWYHCCIPLLATGLLHSDASLTSPSKILMGEGEIAREDRRKTSFFLAGWRWNSAMQEQSRGGGSSHGTVWPDSASAQITIDRLCSDQAHHLPTSLP